MRSNVFQCSSASRKFLNDAIRAAAAIAGAFQCSSASRKFLNCRISRNWLRLRRSFSALQRAENSSIVLDPPHLRQTAGFQCSSASRKFLNAADRQSPTPLASRVSVLFSEPKIPQCRFSSRMRRCGRVSVLFSEPKIPQSARPPSPPPLRR